MRNTAAGEGDADTAMSLDGIGGRHREWDRFKVDRGSGH